MEKAALQLADVQHLITLAEKLDLSLDVLSDEIVLNLPTSTNHPSIYGSLNPLLDCRPCEIADLTENRLYNKAVIAYHQEFLDEQIKKFRQLFGKPMKSSKPGTICWNSCQRESPKPMELLCWQKIWAFNKPK